MSRRRLRAGVSFALLITALLTAIILAVSLGSVRIPLREVFSSIFGPQGDMNRSWFVIIREIRLPRVLAAVMVGGALSVGGTACQGIFRNPLSEPYLLGISAGAALGATIAILTGIPVIGPAAFVGALSVTLVVFLIAGRRSMRSPAGLLLSGLAVSFVVQAVIWLLMTLRRESLDRVVLWTLGSLSAIVWGKVALLAAVTVPVVLVLFAMGRTLDVLSTGYADAHGLGANPVFLGLIILVLTAILSAAAVSTSGIIGFVGLVVPHIMRILGGPSHGKLILRSWIGGGILLVLADLGARTLVAPGELPIGIITALIGGPFLLYLLRAGRSGGRLDG